MNHGGSHIGRGADMLKCHIVVSKFKLQSRYYINFWTHTLGKCMNPFIPYGLSSTTTVLL